jgi:hypothetical protein
MPATPGDASSKRSASSPARSETVASPPAAERILELPSCNGSFVPERSYLGSGWRRRSTRVGPVRLLNMAGLAAPGLARRRAYVIRALHPPSRSIAIGVEGKARAAAGAR